MILSMRLNSEVTSTAETNDTMRTSAEVEKAKKKRGLVRRRDPSKGDANDVDESNAADDGGFLIERPAAKE